MVGPPPLGARRIEPSTSSRHCLRSIAPPWHVKPSIASVVLPSEFPGVVAPVSRVACGTSLGRWRGSSPEGIDPAWRDALGARSLNRRSTQRDINVRSRLTRVR